MTSALEQFAPTFTDPGTGIAIRPDPAANATWIRVPNPLLVQLGKVFVVGLVAIGAWRWATSTTRRGAA